MRSCRVVSLGRWIVASVLLGVTGGLSAAEPAVTTRSLLRDLTDLGQMAEYPSPAYVTRQFSSYDRASKSPTQDGWFANNDFDQYLRTEQRDGRTEYVMADSPGPGAIVRIWSANPKGTLRIYLDGADRPAVETPMETLLSGKTPGLGRPIAGVYGQGYTLYLPIPYAKSCKVTGDQKYYYHVDVRTYARVTPVETFQADDLKALAGEIGAVNERLAKPSEAVVRPSDVQKFRLELKPGASAPLAQFTGAKRIEQFTLNAGPDRAPAALRGIVLRMTFDGERTVEVPLADFFGAGPGMRAYQSLPLGVSDSGEMYSHWVMPFQGSAVIEVENRGAGPIALAGEVGASPASWTDRSMHFHAGYRAEYDAPTRPMRDWNYLTTQGKGVFAGVAFTIDNPVKAWWGEGDEKIYVDGESFPSWFGTGTEDYYSYAWGSRQLFSHAFHAQPQCDGPENYGRTSVNRFHIVDRIPFTKSLKFDMEIWHWKDCKVNMSVTTYWYGLPGASAGYAAVAAADLAVRPVPPYQTHKVPGAIEGEGMKVIAHTAQASPQEWADTSGEHHLWWHHRPKPGDKLVLGFDAPAAGRYRVFGRFLKASDYGTMQLEVNGRPGGKPIDFYNDQVEVTPEMDLGLFDLKAGANEFSATVEGCNPKAKPEYMFGLDYLRLTPEPQSTGGQEHAAR